LQFVIESRPFVNNRYKKGSALPNLRRGNRFAASIKQPKGQRVCWQSITEGPLMKAIASVIAILAFAAAAYAEDAMKSDATPMKSEATEQTATAPAAVPASGTVARAAVTSGIENREPMDELSSVTTEVGKIFYFTELRGMEGQKVTHRWEHNGEVMAEVPFEVGGPRWRVYSSKNLAPSLTGEWKVSVLDANGNPLSTNTFAYNQAPAASAMSDMTPSQETTTSPAKDQNTQMPKTE
jgi:hypothetical protein